jgi:hypothetical protein
MTIRNKIIAYSKLELSWGGVCQTCRFTLPPLAKLAAEYFDGLRICCEHCYNDVDLWECTLTEVRKPHSSVFGLVSLGARQAHFLFDLAAGESKEIDLTQHGISEGATILDVIFTPQGGNCFPLIVHGNRAYVRSVGTKFWVYGRPIVGETLPPGKISASITWAEAGDDSYSERYLLDAFDAAAAQRWSNVILPAYISFEIRLIPLVRACLMKYVSKTKIAALTPSELSSSSAFNVFLPVLTEAAGVPQPPVAISDQLNSLRKLRNKIVHEGVSHAGIDEPTAGEALCATVFGLEYFEYARPRLLAEP